jgi:hypothetical protein
MQAEESKDGVNDEGKENKHFAIGKPEELDKTISLLEYLVANCKKMAENPQLQFQLANFHNQRTKSYDPSGRI